MRIIVTGAGGFVGAHFVATMRATHPEAEVYCCAFGSRSDRQRSEIALDIRDSHAVNELLTATRPTHLVHLAGIAAPTEAAADPRVAWETNVFGTINIGQAILKSAPDCVLIFAGSGEVYGSSADSYARLAEDSLLSPTNEYAVTKAAADLALGALSTRDGLRCIRLRPFNHIGPGQSDKFAIASFAAQIAKIEAGLQNPVLKVGDLTPERDFLDVRDVTRAYTKSIECSGKVPPGEVFNLASGRAVSVGFLLNSLLNKTTMKIVIEQDPTRMRQGQIRTVTGDATKAMLTLGWKPVHNLDETLNDILADWRCRVR
jgi:GDP-4-dehydro-6-deoxy-D-mannose reductase